MVKINLLYYKNILDIVFTKFVQDNNSLFTRDGDKYILSQDFNYSSLKKTFTVYIANELKRYVTPFSITSPSYYFIIGACYPKNNILLKYRGDGYFPDELLKKINCEFPIKYYLKEKDIILNDVRFNQVLIEIFDDCFCDPRNIRSILGKGYENLFFIQHKSLDCYSMFKIIKSLYGKSSCVNIHKEQMSNIRHPIVAINDKICDYIHNKKELLRSDEFNLVKVEIKGYMDECIKNCMFS